jgi:hypothetical protein
MAGERDPNLSAIARWSPLPCHCYVYFSAEPTECSVQRSSHPLKKRLCSKTPVDRVKAIKDRVWVKEVLIPHGRIEERAVKPLDKRR